MHGRRASCYWARARAISGTMGKQAAATNPVGDVIRSRSEARRMTPAKLAQLTRRDYSTVWRWMTGAAIPDYESAKRLKAVLGGRVADYLD